MARVTAGTGLICDLGELPHAKGAGKEGRGEGRNERKEWREGQVLRGFLQMGAPHSCSQAEPQSWERGHELAWGQAGGVPAGDEDLGTPSGRGRHSGSPRLGSVPELRFWSSLEAQRVRDPALYLQWSPM